MLEVENRKREMQAEWGGAGPGTGSCICYSIWEHGEGASAAPSSPTGGAGGVPGDSCWGARFLTEEAVLPGPVPVGARSRSQLPAVWELWERWPLPPQLRRRSLPSTIYSQARSAAPPRPRSRLLLLLPRLWGGGRGAEPPAGEMLRKRGWRGWSSRVSSHQVCCKAPPAGSVPRERQKHAPSSPQTHWGCWEAHPPPKPPCLRSWGPAPEQAASPGSEAAPGRRAHAFQRGVIGALCHSDAYNWRCIV